MARLLTTRTWQLNQLHLAFNNIPQVPKSRQSKVALNVAPLNMEKTLREPNLPQMVTNAPVAVTVNASANAMGTSSSKTGTMTMLPMV